MAKRPFWSDPSSKMDYAHLLTPEEQQWLADFNRCENEGRAAYRRQYRRRWDAMTQLVHPPVDVVCSEEQEAQMVDTRYLTPEDALLLKETILDKAVLEDFSEEDGDKAKDMGILRSTRRGRPKKL